MDPSSDFRFTFGQNHGYLFINYPNGDYAQKKWVYPPATLSNPSSQRFADEGGTDEKGNKLEYIRNDQGADRQIEYFIPDTAQGLTQSDLSRLNQLIEAFVYCVLGAQVNVRSSILGNGGRAKETQRDFLVLLEGAIRTPDISKSVQRYQLAIDEAKVRLDFVAAPGTWLMPSRMVINTGSVTGYNNQLKQATQGMKLGINNDVNKSRKKRAFTSWQGVLQKSTRQTATLPIQFTKQQQKQQQKQIQSLQQPRLPKLLKSQRQRSKQKNQRHRRAPAVSPTMQTK